ncbi:uncharacterized protein TRIADDRAFT_57485 [Trichoplax adhaerens]|uniref:Prolyl 4-hydroxylase alpha subunit Fe(2+) 2OG dioxygenase domain-containing protein n=1 Tax=Trichoplax adhaerens TaxID=10228 RepID=B3RZK1_TRIAD|nr:predicted protein [Trichoplax adhaerens]EDV24219.1 predicted protein [Trichoplax adhaerens]|eukprot:XP_002113745.1 predicted protein [Trichoplax adhaerens]
MANSCSNLILWVTCLILAVCWAKQSTQSKKNALNDDNFDQNRIKSFYTSDHRKISVYNNFLLSSSVFLIRNYLSIYGQWEHSLEDYSNGSHFGEESPDHIMWKTFLNPEFIEKTRFGKKIIRAVNHFKEQQDGDGYHIYDATAKLIRRIDIPKSTIDAPDSEGDVSAILYLIGSWKKNDYGDILFYDDNKEIVGAVHPLMHRMIMFDSSIEHLYKPPAIDNGVAMKTLQIKLTKSVKKVKNAVQHWKLRSQNRIVGRKTTLSKLTTSTSNVIDVEKYITKRYVGPHGRKIFVLDNLFNENDLEKLRKIVKYKRYVFTDRFDEGSDGVSWVATFSLQDFIDSHLWDIHQQVAKHVGNRTTYFPYDVSCNLVQTSDKTRLHDDCAQVADQWTMVTYLNPNWTAQSGGETAFFERKGNDNEYITEVRPRYGRSVIFQGMIYHSARPPANGYNGIRYSFAVKMAEDEAQARVNRVTEDFSTYAANVEQVSSAIKIGYKMGEERTERIAFRSIVGSASASKSKEKEEEEDDEPSRRNVKGNQDWSEDDNENFENQPMQDPEYERELEQYRNPHKEIEKTSNKVAAKKRQELIDSIDRVRSNDKAMAKIQNDFERQINNLLQKLSGTLSKYL